MYNHIYMYIYTYTYVDGLYYPFMGKIEDGSLLPYYHYHSSLITFSLDGMHMSPS